MAEPESGDTGATAALVTQLAALEGDLGEKRALAAKIAAELAEAEAAVKQKEEEVIETRDALALHRARQDPNWRDWAGGLPIDLLAKIAKTHVAQKDADHLEWLKAGSPSFVATLLNGMALGMGWDLQSAAAKANPGEYRPSGLLAFALVCKPWRKAQLKVGGPLCSRALMDVVLPGRVELAKWALAEGCPRADETGFTLAQVAASHGHLELVQWLIQEQGFAMDQEAMRFAAAAGNLELVEWLQAKGCPMDERACAHAAQHGHLEVL